MQTANHYGGMPLIDIWSILVESEMYRILRYLVLVYNYGTGFSRSVL